MVARDREDGRETRTAVSERPEGLRYSERKLWDTPQPTQEQMRTVLARLARTRSNAAETLIWNLRRRLGYRIGGFTHARRDW